VRLEFSRWTIQQRFPSKPFSYSFMSCDRLEIKVLEVLESQIAEFVGACDSEFNHLPGEIKTLFSWASKTGQTIAL
jgi:hypothetical protein